MSRKKHAHDAGGTPATLLLDADGAEYGTHAYAHDPQAPSYGAEAAEALGVDPARVFKTLLIDTGRPGSEALAVAVVPVTGSLDLKAAAMALHVKKVHLAQAADAQRRTGYVLGGISPLGQRHPSTTVLDDSALDWPTIHVSGGRRGLEIELAPQDLIRLTGARPVPLAGP
ncbi:MAG: Cys-tRNA(Pro) deacylase [Arthrobacter sp.]|uniref:Cys-tRNA(Pro) deacylase n=1 Tax=unclassified Arthrobacter TaxID=235627 RepID=UPI002652FFB1|nr:Cys-tRNA(Pro) deacylase [Micrococcaceae bacterium]MDN5811618.1 Cys-tRNA(Pro) deacylase [Micrococcaceae bacterium]MDN5823826.1 Cys-tRNA(Pro) deacylase [Micrococcaceae bacterium]MDN5878773.1 Cys-tRNA(Pro) deacylase [Micrococcaceae bacterium]MDN5886520.1 Cys-tRNA(Pro) deacylase [Micrococcaceae bacterium]